MWTVTSQRTWASGSPCGRQTTARWWSRAPPSALSAGTRTPGSASARAVLPRRPAVGPEPLLPREPSSRALPFPPDGHFWHALLPESADGTPSLVYYIQSSLIWVGSALSLFWVSPIFFLVCHEINSWPNFGKKKKSIVRIRRTSLSNVFKSQSQGQGHRDEGE